MHSYADDTQLYLAFSPNVQGDDASAVKAMRDYGFKKVDG